MTNSISLTPELVTMIEDRVRSGRYASAAEMVEKALRLLAETEGWQAEESALLRQAWSDGAGSGDAGLLDFEELKADGRRRLAGLTDASRAEAGPPHSSRPRRSARYLAQGRR